MAFRVNIYESFQFKDLRILLSPVDFRSAMRERMGSHVTLHLQMERSELADVQL